MPVSRPSLRSARVLSRLLSVALAGAMLTAAMPAQAFAPSGAEIQRMYTEGDKKNTAGDFKGAAETWTRLLLLMPEEGANQATRENILLNILEAHINAYNRLPNPEGKKDVAYLEDGKRTYELYLQQYRAVYGSGRAISLAVQQRSDELNALLVKAEDEGKPTPTPTEPDTKIDPESGAGGESVVDDPKPMVLPPDQNGMGLIVGGAIAGALGVGAVGLLVAGAVSAPRAEQDFELAQNEAVSICPSYPTPCSNLSADEQAMLDAAQIDLDDADKRGRTANALTITGAVLTPVLLGAGAAMLAIGIKRNRKYKAARSQVMLSPTLSSTFAGAVLRGRF